MIVFSAPLPAETSFQELYNTFEIVSEVLAIEMSNQRRSSAFTAFENPCDSVMFADLSGQYVTLPEPLWRSTVSCTKHFCRHEHMEIEFLRHAAFHTHTDGAHTWHFDRVS